MKKNQPANAGLINSVITQKPIFITLAILLTILFVSCFVHKPKAFIPARGMVCEEIIITGTFFHIGQLDGVWLNGLKLEANFERYPAPNGPLVIKAKVPEGAESGQLRVKISTGWGIILGVVGTNYVFPEPFTVTGTPAIPTINSFTANPASIKEGESATLTWDLSTNVTSISINGTATPLIPNTSTVSPAQTTTYTLKARNECLVRSRNVTIDVTPLPKITSTDKIKYHPGENLKANGTGLKRTGEVSKLIFKQGANITEITDASPTNTQLNATLPLTLIAGTATVQAKVSTGLSNEMLFTVEASENGPFIEIKNTVNMTVNKSCMGKAMVLTFNPPGWPRKVLATYTNGATVLAHHNFDDGPISGACFSPKCEQAVSLGFRPVSNDYLAVIERFGTPNYVYNLFTVKIMDGFSTVPERWHCLFSPDDNIVILSTAATGGKMSYVIHDMERKVTIATELGIACTGCSLQARVLNGTQIEVTANGGSFIKTYDIY